MLRPRPPGSLRVVVVGSSNARGALTASMGNDDTFVSVPDLRRAWRRGVQHHPGALVAGEHLADTELLLYRQPYNKPVVTAAVRRVPRDWLSQPAYCHGITVARSAAPAARRLAVASAVDG